MTDFLAHLLDRTLERTPVLRARRPALFEPGPDAPRHRLAARVHAWQGEDDEVTVLSPPAQAPSSRPPAHPRPDDQHVPGDGIPAQATAPPAPPRREAGAGLAGVRTTAHPEPLAGDERVPPSPPGRRRRASVAARPETDLHRAEAVEAPFPQRPAPPRGGDPPRPAPGAPPPLAADGAPARLPAPHAIPPLAVPPLPPVRSAPPVRETPAQVLRPQARPAAPRAAAAASRVASREVPSRPPTISVTIGRIEVRAAPPASPAKSRRVAAPKLTLDDYLRSRGTGSA